MIHFGNIWCAKVRRRLRATFRRKFVVSKSIDYVGQGWAFTFYDFHNFQCNSSCRSTFVDTLIEFHATFDNFYKIRKVRLRIFIPNFRFERLKIPFNTDEDHQTITDSMLSKVIGWWWEMKQWIGKSFRRKISQLSHHFHERKSTENVFPHIKIFHNNWPTRWNPHQHPLAIISIFATITNIVKASAHSLFS